LAVLFREGLLRSETINPKLKTINGLPLALLKAGVLFVNDVQFAFAAYNLTVNAAFFDRCSYFHFIKLLAFSYELLAHSLQLFIYT
jgi:hypothetical protein